MALSRSESRARQSGAATATCTLLKDPWPRSASQADPQATSRTGLAFSSRMNRNPCLLEGDDDEGSRASPRRRARGRHAARRRVRARERATSSLAGRPGAQGDRRDAFLIDTCFAEPGPGDRACRGGHAGSKSARALCSPMATPSAPPPLLTAASQKPRDGRGADVDLAPSRLPRLASGCGLLCAPRPPSRRPRKAAPGSLLGSAAPPARGRCVGPPLQASKSMHHAWMGAIQLCRDKMRRPRKLLIVRTSGADCQAWRCAGGRLRGGPQRRGQDRHERRRRAGTQRRRVALRTRACQPRQWAAPSAGSAKLRARIEASRGSFSAAADSLDAVQARLAADAVRRTARSRTHVCETCGPVSHRSRTCRVPISSARGEGECARRREGAHRPHAD